MLRRRSVVELPRRSHHCSRWAAPPARFARDLPEAPSGGSGEGVAGTRGCEVLHYLEGVGARKSAYIEFPAARLRARVGSPAFRDAVSGVSREIISFNGNASQGGRELRYSVRFRVSRRGVAMPRRSAVRSVSTSRRRAVRPEPLPRFGTAGATASSVRLAGRRRR